MANYPYTTRKSYFCAKTVEHHEKHYFLSTNVATADVDSKL